ncbi:MAG: MFS transporter [Bacillota bacterium]
MIMKRFKKRQDKVKSLFESNMKYFVLNGILFTLVTNLYKPFAQKFLDRIDGTEFHFSLYNALPGLIAVFAVIPGVILMSRAMNKKLIIGSVTFVSRLFILSFALVPFFSLEHQPMIFVALASIMNFPEALFNTSMQSFSGDIFQGKERTTALTYKNKYSQLISFISLLILGQIIKHFGVDAQKTIHIYQLFFILAFIIAIVEISAFFRIKEEKRENAERIELKKIIPEIFRNKAYVKFLVCSLAFHFGWQFGWPLFSIYQIKYLHADETWITILGVTSGIVMFLSFNSWNKIINKKGNHFAIAFATFGMAATPVLYALSFNLYVLTVAGLIMGYFTSGTITVILNSLLEASPEKNRIMYVAVHSTLTNLTLFAAPLFSSMILARSNIYVALLICGGLRFIGSLAFYIRDKHKARLAEHIAISN